jgi:hypothetical protein
MEGKIVLVKILKMPFLMIGSKLFGEYSHALQLFLFDCNLLIVVHFLAKARVFIVKNGEGMAVELCPLNNLGGTEGGKSEIFSDFHRLKEGRVIGDLDELGGNVCSHIYVNIIVGNE